MTEKTSFVDSCLTSLASQLLFLLIRQHRATGKFFAKSVLKNYFKVPLWLTTITKCLSNRLCGSIQTSVANKIYLRYRRLL